MASLATLLLPTLIGGGLGLGSWLLNKIPGLGASAQNINTDYTSNPIWKQMFGSGGGYAGAQSGMSSMLGNAVSAAQSYDPTAFWKDFMAAQPEMQGLVSGGTDSFKSAAQSNLADFVKQATAETGQELSGMGALYSGALGNITGSKIGSEAGKYNTQLAQMQASLLSNLYGNAMPAFAQGRQYANQNLTSTYLQGANTYANQLASMLGIGADLSSPVYQTSPGIGDALLSGLGSGLQAGTGMAMLGGKTTPASTVPPSFNNLGALQMYKALGFLD